MTASADLPAAAPSRHGSIPDFFIVGQFKSGTTALYQMLRRHPQVYMPEYKEVWFHSPELRTRALGRASNSRPETLEDYLSLFDAARPGQRIGEATPSYLISRGAARRIADLQPQARIIAILREPASFLRSFHLQCVQNRTETENDLRKALALEELRREGKEIPRYAARPLELLYSDHVRYVEQLRRYHAVFPPERVLVLIYGTSGVTTRRRYGECCVSSTWTIRIQLMRSRLTRRSACAPHRSTSSCARSTWDEARPRGP
jgi:hypothetical protein